MREHLTTFDDVKKSIQKVQDSLTALKREVAEFEAPEPKKVTMYVLFGSRKDKYDREHLHENVILFIDRDLREVKRFGASRDGTKGYVISHIEEWAEGGDEESCTWLWDCGEWEIPK